MQKTSLRILGAVLVIALLIGCSFAYFTDYATEQATGTAGTVALSMDSNINLLDADGQDIINPGDMRDGSFTVTNEGNKSIDVRTTIVMTALDHEGNAIAFTGDAATQSEYDLYLASDVELVEGYGYQPKAGAQPLQVKSIDGNKITYIVPEYSLNGNSDEYAEVETIDGVDAFSQANDFVFVMKGAAGNEWQNSSVSIDVLVEAKQHENTAAGWNIVAQETITHGAISQEAVKAETVITPGADTENGGEAETTVAFSGTVTMEGKIPTETTMTITNSADPADEMVVTLDENGAFVAEGLKSNTQYNITINGKYKTAFTVPFTANATLNTADSDLAIDIALTQADLRGTIQLPQ